MGYSTSFIGRFEIDPPLNESEQRFLAAFATSRHDEGSYPYLAPPVSIHCDWTPTPDGRWLQWTGDEKTYAAERWIEFLIDELLTGGGASAARAPELAGFTFDHVVNGSVFAAGEALEGDLWRIDVKDNRVSVFEYGKDFMPYGLFESLSSPLEDWSHPMDLFYHLGQGEMDDAVVALAGIVEVADASCFGPIRRFIEDLDAAVGLPAELLELARQVPLEPT